MDGLALAQVHAENPATVIATLPRAESNPKLAGDADNARRFLLSPTGPRVPPPSPVSLSVLGACLQATLHGHAPHQTTTKEKKRLLRRMQRLRSLVDMWMQHGSPSRPCLAAAACRVHTLLSLCPDQFQK
jgi:hypothetical protein